MNGGAPAAGSNNRESTLSPSKHVLGTVEGGAASASGQASFDELRMPDGQPLPNQRSVRARVRLAMLRLIGHAYARRAPAGAPSSVLLVRPDHLGDMLFLTPGLAALRCALPGARITVLAGPWAAEVLRGNPHADAVLTCPFPGFERRPKASLAGPYRLLSAQSQALRGDYDTAVILRFDHWWGAWLAAAAGIPRRIGYAWPEVQPFLTQAVPYQPGRHEVLQNATLLAALAPGRQPELPSTRFYLTEVDRAWAAAWLAQHGANDVRLVAIHPGAGAAVKQWPPAAWAEVASALGAQQGTHILLTGGPTERKLADAVASGASAPMLNAAGQTTLGQLAALYERCALVLGSDSGPLHLAVAVGAATVHLHGPVSADKFGPWGDPARQRVVSSNWRCAPCDRLNWPIEALPQHACMTAISPTQVIALAQSLL